MADTKQWKLLQLAATAVAALLTAIAFIYAFAQQYRSPVWEYTDTYSSGEWYTLESWVCQLQYFVPERAWLNKTCQTADSMMQQAGRWLSLPLLLNAFGLLLLSCLEWRRSRGVVETRDDKIEVVDE